LWVSATFSIPTLKSLQPLLLHCSKLQERTRGYKSGPLLPDALHAFKILQQQLVSDVVMALPHADSLYALITNAAKGTADTLGALEQFSHKNMNMVTITQFFESRQLKDHEKISLYFVWKPLPLFGAWKFLMSTFKEKSLF